MCRVLCSCNSLYTLQTHHNNEGMQCVQSTLYQQPFAHIADLLYGLYRHAVYAESYVVVAIYLVASVAWRSSQSGRARKRARERSLAF